MPLGSLRYACAGLHVRQMTIGRPTLASEQPTDELRPCRTFEETLVRLSVSSRPPMSPRGSRSAQIGPT
jgi:hypothetical protein